MIFKPIPTFTAYASYQEALENGGVAATTYLGYPVTNPGASGFALDSQIEVGAKATLGQTLVTLALFDISKVSNIYILKGNSATYSTDGREEHKGVEVGISGKVLPNLTLFGGATAMDAKITKMPSTPAYVGQLPSGVSKYMAKIYAEYNIDQFPGLVLDAGVQYYSRQAVANVSTGTQQYIGDFAVGNLAARYTTPIYGKDTIFRLSVDNVTNRKYWLSPTVPGGRQLPSWHRRRSAFEQRGTLRTQATTHMVTPTPELRRKDDELGLGSNMMFDSELNWLVPFLCLGAVSLAVARPQPDAPPPSGERIVIDARRKPVHLDLPFRGAVLTRGAQIPSYLEGTLDPNTLLAITAYHMGDRVEAYMLARIFPEMFVTLGFGPNSGISDTAGPKVDISTSSAIRPRRLHGVAHARRADRTRRSSVHRLQDRSIDD